MSLLTRRHGSTFQRPSDAPSPIHLYPCAFANSPSLLYSPRSDALSYAIVQRNSTNHFLYLQTKAHARLLVTPWGTIVASTPYLSRETRSFAATFSYLSSKTNSCISSTNTWLVGDLGNGNESALSVNLDSPEASSFSINAYGHDGIGSGDRNVAIIWHKASSSV